jgi:hypothetical protein
MALVGHTQVRLDIPMSLDMRASKPLSETNHLFNMEESRLLP